MESKMNMEEDTLNLVTGLTAGERKRLFSWIASLPEGKRIDICQDGVKKSFQLRKERPDLPGRINKYCALILIARRSGWNTVAGKGFRVAKQEQFEDFTNLRQAKVAQFLQKGRTPTLKRKIMALWGVVKDLKANEVAFRPMSEYLLKNHKLKVSASYLSTLWKEMEEQHEPPI
jgi:hypothetical protein